MFFLYSFKTTHHKKFLEQNLFDRSNPPLEVIYYRCNVKETRREDFLDGFGNQHQHNNIEYLLETSHNIDHSKLYFYRSFSIAIQIKL
jgi:hypothetical protein